MKRSLLILSLVVLIGCKSKTAVITPEEAVPAKAEILKLPFSEVSEIQKNKAYELGKRVLITCNTSKFKPFNESEATSTVIKNTTLEKLTKICTRYRQYYGTFKDIELVEIYKNYTDNTTIFRYKALYTKKVANKELRLFMNEDGKVSAIKSMDWANTFQLK